MPTNCRGQDKAGHSRGYRWPRPRTGEREVPQAGQGVGQVGTVVFCTQLCITARAGVAPGRQHRPAAQAGGSCSSQEQGQSQILTRLGVHGGDWQQQECCHV